MITFQHILCGKNYMIPKSDTDIPVDGKYNPISLVNMDTDNLNIDAVGKTLT